jgi:hypothetical protein
MLAKHALVLLEPLYQPSNKFLDKVDVAGPHVEDTILEVASK